MNLNEAAENAHKTAIERERNGGPKIRDILKHAAGEVIEVQQARDEWINCGGDMFDSDKERYAEELADVIICALIAAYEDGVDIENAVNEKMQKNAQWAEMQGDKL